MVDQQSWILGDLDQCPWCGIAYDEFRTGWTFKEVWMMFWMMNQDSSTWKNKRRNTVLGRWREIKRHMWQEHLHECMLEDEMERAAIAETGEDDVPF